MSQKPSGAARTYSLLVSGFFVHNGGQIAFNPLATPSIEDYGLLYIGVAEDRFSS